jgi:hypothetical protein
MKAKPPSKKSQAVRLSRREKEFDLLLRRAAQAQARKRAGQRKQESAKSIA